MYKDYYYDKELGMYNINNRFYLLDINRFLIPDSVGNIDIKDIGNLNLYSYSNNNPINGCYKDKLDEIKIFDYIDYGLIIFESLYKTRNAVINNLLNSSMPLELRIGYSLTDALYFSAEGFISILYSLACSYYPFIGPLIEVPVNDYFLDLLEKRW